MPESHVIGIIPARFASTRFPGKPLVMIAGKTMIQRVFQQARQSACLHRVIVATDDQRIVDQVKQFGGDAVMTSSRHASGTDRCMEAVSYLQDAEPSLSVDIVINIQGDEPFLNPAQIDQVAALFRRPEVSIATLAKRITDADELKNSNAVKVVFNHHKRVLTFSRTVIPYQRNISRQDWINHYPYYKHMGIYGYRLPVLKEITSLPVSPLEAAESLEQLRWLENGYDIYIDITDNESVAIDTPDDLLKLSNIIT